MSDTEYIPDELDMKIISLVQEAGLFLGEQALNEWPIPPQTSGRDPACHHAQKQARHADSSVLLTRALRANIEVRETL